MAEDFMRVESDDEQGDIVGDNQPDSAQDDSLSEQERQKEQERREQEKKDKKDQKKKGAKDQSRKAAEEGDLLAVYEFQEILGHPYIVPMFGPSAQGPGATMDRLGLSARSFPQGTIVAVHAPGFQYTIPEGASTYAFATGPDMNAPASSVGYMDPRPAAAVDPKKNPEKGQIIRQIQERDEELRVKGLPAEAMENDEATRKFLAEEGRKQREMLGSDEVPNPIDSPAERPA